MIFDYIEKWPMYFNNGALDSAYLKLCELLKVMPTPGEYQLDDYDIFFKVLGYETKDSNWITESHRKYVDIQIVIDGEEQIKLYEKGKLDVLHEYNPENDCEFYKQPVSSIVHNSVILRAGHMGVFFPQDVHMTQIAPAQIQNIKKIVIKVNEKYFS